MAFVLDRFVADVAEGLLAAFTSYEVRVTFLLIDLFAVTVWAECAEFKINPLKIFIRKFLNYLLCYI